MAIGAQQRAAVRTPQSSRSKYPGGKEKCLKVENQEQDSRKKRDKKRRGEGLGKWDQKLTASCPPLSP